MRQSCPLSGLLFVIGLELLARAIKRDALIRGIVIGKVEIKTSMYVDNTTVSVQDTDSILQLLNMLEKIISISGLLSTHQKPRQCGWAAEKTCAIPLSTSNAQTSLFAR